MILYYRSACAVLFIAGSLLAAGSPVFIPGQYAPVSPFKNSSGGDTLVLSVRPEVIEHIETHRGELGIARWRDGSVSYRRPDTIVDAGAVVLYSTTDGKYVAVTDVFTNQLPVVTHWEQSLNSGRGGFRAGAADAIDLYDFDTATATTRLSTGNYADTCLKNPLFYDSSFALFSDDPVDPGAYFPGYERYVGEKYSITGVSDLFALAFCHEVLHRTGYPVVLNNSSRLFSGIPAFQILNSYPIEETKGKGGLATAIVPPFWVDDTLGRYPTVFYSHYDINEAVYNGLSLELLEMVRDAIDRGRTPPLLLFFNGGGARATYSIQRSVYDNIAAIFSAANTYLHADTDAIITAGISRSGLSALLAAGNPYHDSYKVACAISYNPPLKMGDMALVMHYTTCPSLASVVPMVTGFDWAWQDRWELEGMTGGERALNCVLGVTSRDEANQLSVWGDACLDRIAEAGTRVILASGTHDSYMCFYPVLEFSERAKRRGIPLSLEVGLRAGHTMFTSMSSKIALALNALYTGEPYVLPRTSFFRKVTRADTTLFENFTPGHFPVLFEAPQVVCAGSRSLWCLAGEAGTEYRVTVTKMDDEVWQHSEEVALVGEPIYLMSGTLYSSVGRAGFALAGFQIPRQGIELGRYLYEVVYRLPGAAKWQTLSTPARDDSRVCTLRVIGEPYAIPGKNVAAMLAPDNVGWGLAEW